jgi:superfamily I DNA/RNA helicase
VAQKYQAFKKANGVLDYTDMLKRAANIEKLDIPYFKYLFVDEAQDLSTLQWLIIDRIAEFADNVIIAGDDKQSINSHAGADVDYFLNIDAPVQVLKQSYRVPKAVFDIANQIVSHMHKFRKDGSYWIARSEQGAVHFVRKIPLKEMAYGQWLLLSRTNYAMDKLAAELIDRCQEMCVAFTVNHKPPIDIDALETQEAFAKLRPMEKVYAQYLLPHWKVRGMELFDNAPVRLLTIHGAKGTEADNVVLIDNVTRKIAKAMYDGDSDTEAKVFYVGVTRAKQNLYIVTADVSKPNYRARYL